MRHRHRGARGRFIARYPDQWSLGLLGLGIASVFLVSAMAGVAFDGHPGNEFDLFAAISRAFVGQCGFEPWWFSFLVGIVAGWGLHLVTQENAA